MRVKQLAENVGVPPDTIRYYTKRGLLSPRRERRNGYYCFGDAERRRLQFILNARDLGLSIEAIELLLNCANRKRSRCPEARHLIEETLTAATARLETLQEFCGCLQEATANWSEIPRGSDVSALIDTCAS